jgi:hypothetical protein
MFRDILAKKSADNSKVVFGPLASSAEAERVFAATGYDVSGFRHVIRENEMWHLIQEHGMGYETDRGQSPLTEVDIALIPEIVGDPDHIVAGRARSGLRSIEYVKRIGDRYSVVEVVLTKKKHLSLRTMWRRG